MDWIDKVDNYFTAKTIKLSQFSNIGEIRSILKLLNAKDNQITPEHCIHILETTQGIPSKVVSSAANFIGESNKLTTIHNQFIVDNLTNIDEICRKFKPIFNSI